MTQEEKEILLELLKKTDEIPPNRIIGTEEHIKVALDVLDKKGGKK